MARTSRPDSIYRVSLHRNGGHLYAATHPYTVDAQGKRKYSIIHWGTVTEDLRFIPGKRYIEATEQTRSLLVFPEEWDISAAERIVRTDSDNASGTPLPFSPADEGKTYGSVWLLGRVSSRFSLRNSLSATGSARTLSEGRMGVPVSSAFSSLALRARSLAPRWPSKRTTDFMGCIITCFSFWPES